MPKSRWRARKGVSGMLAVFDTNVLVSASLNRAGTPGQLVVSIRSRALTPVLCTAIRNEYADVLRRARFSFPHAWVDDLLADMDSLALHMRPANIATSTLPDHDDVPFIAAALAAMCPIVTGNARHFPAECGVEILSPAQCLARFTV